MASRVEEWSRRDGCTSPNPNLALGSYRTRERIAWRRAQHAGSQGARTWVDLFRQAEAPGEFAFRVAWPSESAWWRPSLHRAAG